MSNTRELLLDSNLLLLLIAGRVDIELLERHKRLVQFERADFVLLAGLCRRFVLRTNAHILTEVSNLAGLTREPDRSTLLAALATFIRDTGEIASSSVAAARRPEFPSLGLTDSVLLDEGAGFNIISVDYRLVNHLQSLGYAAINFNQIRGVGRSVS